MFKPLFIITVIAFVSACKPVTEQSNVPAQKRPVPQCIPSQSLCKITHEEMSYSIKFSQLGLSDNVKTELPFIIELTQLINETEQASISKVSAYLEGKDMFMGKVPVFFEKDKAGEHYLAETLLANCSEEQMVWRLWVTIERLEQEERFFIDFTSQRL